jgi:hypothetical protein
VFLASDDATYVSGTILDVDGALSGPDLTATGRAPDRAAAVAAAISRRW